MSKSKPRSFSRDFKLRVIERMEAGGSASALSKELSVKRTLLYRWRDAFRSGGEAALRSGPGRPTRAEAVALAAVRGPLAKANDLAAAQRRIAELERKIGQQHLDLDFFKAALRRIEASRQPSDGRGATASSRASKR
jgi:transposase-like protein